MDYLRPSCRISRLEHNKSDEIKRSMHAEESTEERIWKDVHPTPIEETRMQTKSKRC